MEAARPPVTILPLRAGAAPAAELARIHAEALATEPAPAWDAASFAALLDQPAVRALVARGGPVAPGFPTSPAPPLKGMGSDQGSSSGLEAEAAPGAGFILTSAVLDEAEILMIAVVPAQRRGGLGRQLLNAAIADLAARGVTRLFLEVAEDNRAARALYATAGFSAAGTRRGYYARQGSPAVDALILHRSLSLEQTMVAR